MVGIIYHKELVNLSTISLFLNLKATELLNKTPIQITGSFTLSPTNTRRLNSSPTQPEATVSPILTEPAAIPTMIPSPTISYSPNATLQPGAFALDSIIGETVQYLIHRVSAGESLEQYATRYNTTVTAIKASNAVLPSVLYINWIIVIPVNINDVTGLPAFEPYMITETSLSVEKLAEHLNIATGLMCLYNNIESGYVFTQGDWVLIPSN